MIGLMYYINSQNEDDTNKPFEIAGRVNMDLYKPLPSGAHVQDPSLHKPNYNENKILREYFHYKPDSSIPEDVEKVTLVFHCCTVICDDLEFISMGANWNLPKLQPNCACNVPDGRYDLRAYNWNLCRK